MNIGWAVNCWVKHTATLRYLSMTILLFVIPNYPEFPEYYSMDKDYNKDTGAITTSTDEGIVATKQAGW